MDLEETYNTILMKNLIKNFLEVKYTEDPSVLKFRDESYQYGLWIAFRRDYNFSVGACTFEFFCRVIDEFIINKPIHLFPMAPPDIKKKMIFDFLKPHQSAGDAEFAKFKDNAYIYSLWHEFRTSKKIDPESCPFQLFCEIAKEFAETLPQAST